MNKSTIFSGPPIFTQLLKFISQASVLRLARRHQADYYSKRFTTYEHLVTMLYAIFNHCHSLREVTTGMLALGQRLTDLGLRYHPRRSTLSDANSRRTAAVFEDIYYSLYKRYAPLLSDRRKSTTNSRLYIFDTTTISLFQEVLRTSGKNPSGKRKGGIKVHALMRSDQDVPCLIRYSAAAANDSPFLKALYLPKGSVLVFDRGYYDFDTLNRFCREGVTWVSRLRQTFAYGVLQEYEPNSEEGVVRDQQIQLGWRCGIKVTARLVQYRDPQSGNPYQFISNNFRMKAVTIAALYKRRWQIELLFKRMKQNYPLKYFLGDGENAIKIQIWCSLIADLLLKIVKKGVVAKWSFSNLVAMVRLHLMAGLNLARFLKTPEKELMELFSPSANTNVNQLLLMT